MASCGGAARLRLERSLCLWWLKSPEHITNAARSLTLSPLDAYVAHVLEPKRPSSDAAHRGCTLRSVTVPVLELLHHARPLANQTIYL